MREPSLLSTVWLPIWRAQRPVSRAEIRASLRDLSDNQIGPALNVAHRLGYIERSGEPRRYSYRVTPRCTVPPGVPILEILEGASA